jgi:hypothetical protein
MGVPRAAALRPAQLIVETLKKKEKGTPKGLNLESVRGPPRVLAHKVRRRVTTNAFDGIVSLLLRRDPESFSAAERKEEAREASAFRFAILHQSFALIRLH